MFEFLRFFWFSKVFLVEFIRVFGFCTRLFIYRKFMYTSCTPFMYTSALQSPFWFRKTPFWVSENIFGFRKTLWLWLEFCFIKIWPKLSIFQNVILLCEYKWHLSWCQIYQYFCVTFFLDVSKILLSMFKLRKKRNNFHVFEKQEFQQWFIILRKTGEINHSKLW